MDPLRQAAALCAGSIRTSCLLILLSHFSLCLPEAGGEKLHVLMIRKRTAAEFILEECREGVNDIQLGAEQCG